MICKIFISYLLMHCQLNVLQYDGNAIGDIADSYLIEEANVRGMKVGEVNLTFNLNGSYIVESVRINASTAHHQMFRMLVNDKRTSYICNQTFVDEDKWVVIKCNDPLVIGREVIVMTNFDNDDQINHNLLINVCTKTIYPILESDFEIDSSEYNGINTINDGDINTCLTFTKWFSYKRWILIKLRKEFFIEAVAVLGIQHEFEDDFVVQIKNLDTIDILPNEPLCNLSQNFIFSCNKRGKVVHLQTKIAKGICEILLFGSKQLDTKEKIQGGCNFRINNNLSIAISGKENQISKVNPENTISNRSWTIRILLICMIFLLLIFVAWVTFKLKPRCWQGMSESILMQDLQTTKLQQLTYKKLFNGEFEKEFLKLPKEDVKSSTYGLYLHHIAKNRFRNIIPFDENLVKLEGDANNYINASFIRGYDGDSNAYIATQGPKTNTLNDFWNLVWQYKVEVIVMLTQLFESCSNKCVQYWPDCNEPEAIFGKLSVTIVKESHCSDYVCRYLVVKMINQHMEATRAVIQFQFMSWSDNLTPSYCFPLLDFREKVNCVQRHCKSPLLVHCSAGVGRTGTYIAIDYLIKQAKIEGKISVYKCVKDLRLQRMLMVQNKKQYLFIYKTVAEAVRSLNFGMHCADFTRKFNVFMSQNSTQIFPNAKSRMLEESEKSFKVLKRITQTSEEKVSEGFRTINCSKNRNRSIVAFDDHRLHVNGGPACNGYINAVSIQCHKTSNIHILTQIPLPKTRSDFWHMLWEHDIRQILLLEDDRKHTSYWPEYNALPFDKLTISLTMEENPNDFYVIRKFLIESSANNDRRENAKEITQYHVTKCLWSEHSQLPANANQFLKILKQLVDSNKRTVLQCLNGSTRSGLAAAAMLIIDMILSSEEVNPFLACRYVKACRPEAISTLEDYNFLHELALVFIEDFGNYSRLPSSDYDLEREQH